MASEFEQLRQKISRSPRVWLVTGAAGFIGSHLVEELLGLGGKVVGLDNFATGKKENLDDVRAKVGSAAWANFRMETGDIVNIADCHRAVTGVDYVLHQAALGSVPRSIEDPIRSHVSNVDGFLNMLVACRDAKVRRLVYASSSSVYGDSPELPKREENIGRPLSPYAATKVMNEIYAGVFARNYGISTIGLRYFNIFGPRQDAKGAYAAVIPRWFAALARGEPPQINGDGLTSRDFCYVANAVQANLLAATTANQAAENTVFNVACGERATLLELFEGIRDFVAVAQPAAAALRPVFDTERAGDVRHSLADISRVRAGLGYVPTHSLKQGLRDAARWYMQTSEGFAGKP